MPATVTALSTPNRPHDPAVHAGLAELFQLGLTVARAAARLAEIEHASLDALADAATKAAQALATTPSSLDDAIRTGRNADTVDAARDAVATRIASVAQSFEKAARAVRRTAALQARLASARPFRDPAATPARLAIPREQASHAPANDAEPPEHPDTPEDRAEDGHELGLMTDQQALEAIHQDLAAAQRSCEAIGPRTGPMAEPTGAASHLAHFPADGPTPRPTPETISNPVQTGRHPHRLGAFTPTPPPVAPGPVPAPDT